MYIFPQNIFLCLQDIKPLQKNPMKQINSTPEMKPFPKL